MHNPCWKQWKVGRYTTAADIEFQFQTTKSKRLGEGGAGVGKELGAREQVGVEAWQHNKDHSWRKCELRLFEKLMAAMLRSAPSYYNYEFPMDGIHVSGGLMTLLNVQFET